MKVLVTALALTAAIVTAAPAAAQKTSDIPNASDHPLVGRYEGSIISFYQVKGYEELSLPQRGVARDEQKTPELWQTELSGKLTSIRYEGPADRSVLEVLRNYEAALKQKGFEIVFFCRAKQCAPGGPITAFFNAARANVSLPSSWDSSTYLLARRGDAQSAVTVGIYGVETTATNSRPLRPHVAVTVVEGKPMETDKVTVLKASEMASVLSRDGRVAIYGIYFDFDKSDIRSESAPQIEQLAALLKSSPKLEILVVGHTDGSGAFDYNLSLSQRRAQAVVQALTGQGIEARRLAPAGAGMIAPVATNHTDQGRAKNRRVEVVERYTGK